MGFISGVVMGMIVGVALFAGWSRAMDRRAAKRSAKAADINSLGSLNREDVKKICGENLPEWISFPEYEQVKWLNRQLSKFWPFVEDVQTTYKQQLWSSGILWSSTSSVPTIDE